MDNILAVTAGSLSRGYYSKLANELPAEPVRTIISEARQAHLEGRITSPARYCTDLTERYRGNKPPSYSS